MRFGPVPVAEAEGAVLAHSLSLPDGKLKKGKRLGAEDVGRLRAAGLDSVIAARLDPGDMGEDDAATVLAAAIAPDPAAAGLRLTRAHTGRVNLYAMAPGVLGLDVPALHAANRVDAMLTVASLPPFARVAAGTMVATVKIISYAVPRDAVERAAAAAADAMRVHPVRMRSATLIQTDIGAGPGKGEQAMAGRLAALGMALERTITVPHAVPELASAIDAAPGDLVLVLTASATSDPADVAPEAVRQAGGHVTRFGMPVDPGNLLFLGAQGGRPVIGLPGCARSPALNGADWVLERVVCGLAVSDDDIAGMGIGGLLKESPARPSPREGGN